MSKMIKSMFSDVDGCISSKRTITFLAFVLCGIAFIAELFWGYKVSENAFDSMVYLVIAGLGFTASEKFTSKEKGFMK